LKWCDFRLSGGNYDLILGAGSIEFEAGSDI
jgi:hypothetical protein